MLTRVAVPAGWMPSAGGSLFAIEPCPAAAPLVATPMHHGMAKDQPAHDRSRKTPDCPFAPLVAAGLPPLPAVTLAAPAPVVALAYWRPRPISFLTAGTSRLPPSTGPPART